MALRAANTVISSLPPTTVSSPTLASSTDRAATRASADMAVMEETVSNFGSFLDDDAGADYRARDGSAGRATRQRRGSRR